MKKILVLFLALVLVLGITSITFAVTEEEVIKEEPVKIEMETANIEDTVEEIPIEESTITIEDTVEPEVIIEDEVLCPHMDGEWYYDLTENTDGTITYFRTCDCGAYEELSKQSFYDLGGQYEDCDKGRHYWCEENDDTRYCEECGYSETY